MTDLIPLVLGLDEKAAPKILPKIGQSPPPKTAGETFGARKTDAMSPNI